MPVEFKLPDLGEGIHEGEVIEVLVKAGDEVEDGQTVLVIETDKAAAEVPSPVTGAVAEVRVKPGQTVRVGEVLIVFTEKDEAEGKRAAPPRTEESEKGALEERAEAKGKEAVEAEKETPVSAGPVPAAPSTRRLARELGIDLAKVTPSGPGGRVSAEDVRGFAEKAGRVEAGKETVSASAEIAEKEEEAIEVSGGAGREERIPLRSIRRATAQRMAVAWAQIPHVTHMDAADLTELDAFRRKHREQVEAQGGDLSLMVFVMKAAAAALKKFPTFNSSLDMESGEIILKHYHNIGFAMDTDRGLLVPVIRNVDCKSLLELAVEFRQIGEKTRQGKATRQDLSGGTFTITTVGPLGGTGISPIINYPEAAILGMARAKLQPVVIGDQKNYEIVARLMLPLSITFDHRILDGAEAARFLNLIKSALEEPETLLMMS
ncbi:MAG: dihydrolipoamide acetyltransferase family protein [Syntrophobacteraceae bacterium]|nr:dihydrolipoamide acetyltransferase family protein [Syntrophobacteraceae bacterium]